LSARREAEKEAQMYLLVLSLASGALVSMLALRADLLPPVPSQTSLSAARVAAVTSLLDKLELDAVAAHEDTSSGRFAAALYFPDVQLLVVSALHPQPDLAAQQLAERRYRDVYLDLQGAATRIGRFFVVDMQADGLKRTHERGTAFDQTYINGAERISYAGDWTGQKMSQSKYGERFRRDDERYVKLLTALEQELMRHDAARVR
jgi:hypothetical protein